MLQALDGVELDGNDPVSRALGQMGEESISDLQSRLERELVRATELEKQHKTAPSMVVSLDHSIYFHNPLAFRADEWMLTEMESPWAGEGRGLVFQKIWSRDGTLIATCTQEVCHCISLSLSLYVCVSFADDDRELYDWVRMNLVQKYRCASIPSGCFYLFLWLLLSLFMA